MIRFKAKIELEKRPGDKLGWSFILLNPSQSARLNPGVRRSFRVKGSLDEFEIERTSLLPVRGGRLMLPFNASMRRNTGKKAGDSVWVELEVDKRRLPRSLELIACLKDEPAAQAFFKSLNQSHQNYFNNWVRSAKTAETKSRRITTALQALSQQKNYTMMVRERMKAV